MNCIEFNSWDLWIPSVTLALIVQLHTKLLVTVRDTSADCNWSTKAAILTLDPTHFLRDKRSARPHVNKKK